MQKTRVISLDDLLRVAIVGQEREIIDLRQKDLEMYVTATEYTLPTLRAYTDFFEEALIQLWEGRSIDAVRDIGSDEKGGLEFKIGNIQFCMKKPAASPSYAEMCRGLLRYLTHMLEEWGAEKRVEGVLEIDDRLYLSVNDVYREFKRAEIFFRGEKKPEVKYNKPDYDVFDVEKLLFSLEEFGKVTVETARKYRIAKEQIKLIETEVVERVRDEIKAQMEYDKHNIPDTTVVDGFIIGRFLVWDMMSPRDVTQYKGVYEGIKEYVTEGEQVALSTGQRHGIFRVRDGIVYAEITRIAKKFMDSMRDPELNGRTLQHRIQVLPKPRYDGVVVAT